MINSTSTQIREAVRASLAEQMAAYEQQYGEIQTLPIRVGDAPIETFSINVPGKPKAAKPSRDLRSQDFRRVTTRTQKKLENVRKVRELAATGMRIADMAEQTGLTAKYIMKLINEHGLPRSKS